MIHPALVALIVGMLVGIPIGWWFILRRPPIPAQPRYAGRADASRGRAALAGGEPDALPAPRPPLPRAVPAVDTPAPSQPREAAHGPHITNSDPFDADGNLRPGYGIDLSPITPEVDPYARTRQLLEELRLEELHSESPQTP